MEQEFMFKIVTDFLPQFSSEIKEVFDTLYKNNYDVLSISQYSQEIMDALEKVTTIIRENWDYFCKVYESGELRVNLPLWACLNNVFTYVQPIVAKRVSGTGSVTKLVGTTSGITRTIYIFSDKTHTRQYDCKETDAMPIGDYLRQLYKTSDKFIDIFVEFEKYRQIYHGSSYLADVQEFLHKCTDPKLRAYTRNLNFCTYNSRIHYVDIRYVELVCDKFISYVEKWPNVSDRNKDKQILLDYLKYGKFLLEDKLRYYAYANRVVDKNNFLGKTIAKFPDKDFVRYIIAIILDYYYVDSKTYINNIDTLIDYIEKDSPELYEKRMPQHFLNISELFRLYVMDIYFFLRVFKRYKTDKSLDPEYAKFIVFYGGSAHTDAYISIFQKLGFEIKEHAEGDDISCLDMRKIRQPLFQ